MRTNQLENVMNVRQRKTLAAMRHTGGELAQPYDSAAWYVWHPEHYWVRLSLTCRDVWELVEDGFVSIQTGGVRNSRHLLNT